MSVSANPPRQAKSRPFPDEPVGWSGNPALPFKHLIVLMMENHSFDNLLGEMPLTRPDVDGLKFENGQVKNSNPDNSDPPIDVTAYPLTTTAQGSHVSQSWKDSHEQINGGAMDGFVKVMNDTQPMGYYTSQALPFAYSLASEFTVGDRWFCSLPGPTYPNRRFLLAGTAYGTTQTQGDPLIAPSPGSGTVFDLLSGHGITWADYFSDIPMSLVIGRGILEHFENHHPIGDFYAACQTGNLPQVSFIDPLIGLNSPIGLPFKDLPEPIKGWLTGLNVDLENAAEGETEEDPQDLYYGERFAHKVVTAVTASPAWKDICLVYVYDEHGGYYDHVSPPAAIAPDTIKPVLQTGDPVAGYTMYGPRVPAVVVSPYSKPRASTSVVHDHTSVLATIQAKWNLPALTLRDANAHDISDFLDPHTAALLTPPGLAAPGTGPAA
jgi:phospholipase C